MGRLKFIKDILTKFAELVGLNLVITKRAKKSESYEPVAPQATYAPWLSDSLFNETYQKIKKYTMVDEYRCYELWQLVAEASKLEGALIEVGVWRGGSGALISKKAKIRGIKDNVYLCDTFKGVVKAGVYDSYHDGGEHANTSKATVEGLLKKLELNNSIILEGIFPDETGGLITDNKFRFCHVDVDVCNSAKDIIDWIWPRLVVGGIIVFDDYGFSGCDGITRLVNEERNKEDRLILHNLNGHAIMVKLATRP